MRGRRKMNISSIFPITVQKQFSNDRESIKSAAQAKKQGTVIKKIHKVEVKHNNKRSMHESKIEFQEVI